jgi:hypothetical protein
MVQENLPLLAYTSLVLPANIAVQIFDNNRIVYTDNQAYGVKWWLTNFKGVSGGSDLDFREQNLTVVEKTEYINFILKYTNLKRACSTGTFLNNGAANEDRSRYTVPVRLYTQQVDGQPDRRNRQTYSTVSGTTTVFYNHMNIDLVIPKTACQGIDRPNDIFLNAVNDETLRSGTVTQERIQIHTNTQILVNISTNKEDTTMQFGGLMNLTTNKDLYTNSYYMIQKFMITFCKAMDALTRKQSNIDITGNVIYERDYLLNYGKSECACLNNEFMDTFGQYVPSVGGEDTGLPAINDPINTCRWDINRIKSDRNAFITPAQFNSRNTAIQVTICQQQINLNNITAQQIDLRRNNFTQACGNIPPAVSGVLRDASNGNLTALTVNSEALRNYNTTVLSLIANYTSTRLGFVSSGIDNLTSLYNILNTFISSPSGNENDYNVNINTKLNEFNTFNSTVNTFNNNIDNTNFRNFPEFINAASIFNNSMTSTFNLLNAKYADEINVYRVVSGPELVNFNEQYRIGSTAYIQSKNAFESLTNITIPNITTQKYTIPGDISSGFYQRLYTVAESKINKLDEILNSALYPIANTYYNTAANNISRLEVYNNNITNLNSTNINYYTNLFNGTNIILTNYNTSGTDLNTAISRYSTPLSALLQGGWKDAMNRIDELSTENLNIIQQLNTQAAQLNPPLSLSGYTNLVNKVNSIKGLIVSTKSDYTLLQNKFGLFQRPNTLSPSGSGIADPGITPPPSPTPSVPDASATPAPPSTSPAPSSSTPPPSSTPSVPDASATPAAPQAQSSEAPTEADSTELSLGVKIGIGIGATVLVGGISYIIYKKFIAKE